MKSRAYFDNFDPQRVQPRVRDTPDRREVKAQVDQVRQLPQEGGDSGRPFVVARLTFYPDDEGGNHWRGSIWVCAAAREHGRRRARLRHPVDRERLACDVKPQAADEVVCIERFEGRSSAIEGQNHGEQLRGRRSIVPER